MILENDGDVLKWFKPAKGVFQIRYNRNDDEYVPDFRRRDEDRQVPLRAQASRRHG